MGKNVYSKHVNDELDDINPSCMWGIVHAIGYHHLRCNVKRMLPHRRNQGRAKSHGSPKPGALDHVSSEMQMLLHEEERTFPVKQSNKENASINKRSLKARIKAFITDQSHKGGKEKPHGSRFSSQSGLERIYSNHHHEPPDHGFGELCTDWENPIIFFPSNEVTGQAKLQDPTKDNGTETSDAGQKKFNKSSTKDSSKDKLKEQDLLEVLKVNKDLFLEILKNADDGIRKFSRALPASKAKSRLTKSGSFPVGDFSQRKNLGPSKLHDKQNEVWLAPRREKFPMDALNYSKNLLFRSGPLANKKSGISLGRALSLILESTIESEREGNGDLFLPLKESKQEVQFEGMQGKSEANSSLSVLGEISSGQKCSKIEKDFAESCSDSTVNRDGDKSSSKSHERDDFEYRISTFSHRRSSSLNESLNKYASLFESSFGKEVKLRSSKSLKLNNENEMRSGKSASFLFTRIRSLSHLDELYSSLQNVVKGDANFADWPITFTDKTSSRTKGDTVEELKPTDISRGTDECMASDGTKEPGHQDKMLERSDGKQPVHDSVEPGENIAGECSSRRDNLPEQLTVGESNSYRDQETKNLEITNSKFQEPCPGTASEKIFEDEASSFLEFQSAEGSESRYDHADEEPPANWQSSIDKASSSLLTSSRNLDHVPISDNTKASDLDYVRELLERSGFTKNAFQLTWHSLDQPLNPSLYEEMEAYWHQEMECSKEEIWSCYHHQLLFELVNEELARLYDKSLTYYPKALSPSCHLRPFPVGNHLLEEICSSISSLVISKPEEMQTLDSIVDLDLRKNDSWMNLQMESECLGLEVEDMIFDELLHEILCS